LKKNWRGLRIDLKKAMKTKVDEALEEIWSIRRQIAKKFGNDPQKKVAYYQRTQKERGMKMYQPGMLAPADARHDRARAEIAASQPVILTSYRANPKRKPKRAK
jgi:hypothetical protein